MTEGDSHYWGVWWGKQPFEVYTEKVPRFMSEYGFQGFPYPETVKRFSSTENKTPDSTELKCHQKHPIGYETIDEYLERESLQPKTLLNRIYQSQLLQAKGMDIAMEAHRRAKPYCMGSLFWQLNDCWPVVSWSAIDFYGNRKAVYYTAKHAFADVLVSPVEKDGKLSAWIISDRLSSFDATISAMLMTFYGEIVAEEEALLRVTANSSTKIDLPVIDTAINGQNRQKGFVLFEMKDANGKPYQSTHYFASLGKLSIPATAPIIQIDDINGKKYLSISSSILVKSLFVWFVGIEAQLEENFVDIIPGKAIKIEVKTNASTQELTHCMRTMWLNQ